nr:ATP-binding cassette domain-containing protein [Anaerolinea sp.]
PVQARSLKFRFTPAMRSGDLVLRTYGLGVGYQDEKRVLFSVPDLVLRRGECAAVIGPNGAGKTTFLKTILGQIPPLAGEVQLGASLEIGYFAQAHEGLNSAHNLVEEIEGAAPQMRIGEIRDYLAKFLFTGDDVFKPVGLLSGGERGRLALAILALSNANLLLLDEPTNHLDLPSQEVLQAVLSNYGGTILLVSHDRYLIDGQATQVWEVLPEQGVLRIFEGAYSAYKQALAAEAAVKASEAPAPRKAEPPQPEPPAARRTGRSNNRERERLQRIEQMEREIERLEAELARVGRLLENPPAEAARVQALGEEYVRLQHALDEHMHLWGEMLSQSE